MQADKMMDKYGLFIGMFSLAGLFAGLFLALKPRQAMEMQRKFYLLINWKIEPVSYEKEVRNTRIMGVSLIIAIILIFIMHISKIF